METLQLPSAIQPQEVAYFNLKGEEHPAKISKVHFSESKVTYDLDLYIDQEPWSTRIYNVDSAFMSKYKTGTEAQKTQGDTKGTDEFSLEDVVKIVDELLKHPDNENATTGTKELVKLAMIKLNMKG